MQDDIHVRVFEYRGPQSGLAAALSAAGFSSTSASESIPGRSEGAEGGGATADEDIERLRQQLRNDPEFINRAASRLPFTDLQKHVFRTMLHMPEQEYQTRPAIAEAAGMTDARLGAIFGNLGRRFVATDHSLGVDMGLSVAMEFDREHERGPWLYRLNREFRRWLREHPEAIDPDDEIAA